MNKKNEYVSFYQRFFKTISSGSTLLMLSTVVAVVWANINYESYEHLWHDIMSITIHKWSLSMSWHMWINDGLMTLFFFVVGLEIKREFVAGELSSRKKAILPIFAAIGGMVIPILFFLIFNLKGEAAKGWAIPMATDIAFSLGILSMLGKRVPTSLKIFLTALAIVDDLGAVMIIALFYGGSLQWSYLAIAGGLLLILLIANYYNIQNLWLYTIVGLLIWYLFLISGVDGPGTGLHATIAGVLVALTIPTRPKENQDNFIENMKKSLDCFGIMPANSNKIVLTHHQLEEIERLEDSISKIRSPLQYIEHQFESFISMFVIPLFALANAGILLTSNGNSEVFTIISLAIAISMVLGKVIGITFFSWIAIKLKLATKPEKSSKMTFIGLGLLGGIGFTMSIFISNLAYSPELLNQAKIGVFSGSILAGVAGYLILMFSLNRK